MTTVYVGGTFDLFHYGHVNLLRTCRLLGSVVVALNTDEFIKEYKGEHPVCTLEERMAVVEACKYVSRVVVNEDGSDSKPSILKVNPDVIVMGTDWVSGYREQLQVTDQWLAEQGIRMVFLQYTDGISTTAIKKRML